MFRGHLKHFLTPWKGEKKSQFVRAQQAHLLSERTVGSQCPCAGLRVSYPEQLLTPSQVVKALNRP